MRNMWYEFAGFVAANPCNLSGVNLPLYRTLDGTFWIDWPWEPRLIVLVATQPGNSEVTDK